MIFIIRPLNVQHCPYLWNILFMIACLSRLLSLVLFIGAVTASPAPDAYWIWAGIEAKEAPREATLYVYQGHIHSNRLTAGGLSPHRMDNDVYLVYRITGDLPDPGWLVSVFQETARRWQRRGVTVLGMQLDFDSPTSKLLLYSQFLEKLRKHLPATYGLSITGLADWIVFGNKNHLKEMAEHTNEIVFQLYQDRRHFKNIDRYITALHQLRIAYKIGLLTSDNPARHRQEALKDPQCKGVVLFIQK